MPAELLLALVEAESGLNPRAARYGVWPDVSFGLCQQTVETAGGYGIGDGSNTPDNIANVRATLWSRTVSLDLAARILAGALAVPAVNHDWLNALVTYNAGWLPPSEHSWWVTWAANVDGYKLALAWAHETLAPPG